MIADWWGICKISEKCVSLMGSELQFQNLISKYLLVRTLQIGNQFVKGIEDLLNSDEIPQTQKIPILLLLDPCQYGMKLHPTHLICLPVDPDYPSEDVFNPDNPSIVLFSLVMLLLSLLMVLTVCVFRRIDIQKR